MNIIDSKIDLAASFKKLSKYILELESIDMGPRERYEKLFYFTNRHISECTLPDNVEAADADDLKGINI